MRDDLKTMVRRIEETDTISGWSARMDAKLILIKEDPVLYSEAARTIARKEIEKDFGRLGRSKWWHLW